MAPDLSLERTRLSPNLGDAPIVMIIPEPTPVGDGSGASLLPLPLPSSTAEEFSYLLTPPFDPDYLRYPRHYVTC